MIYILDACALVAFFNEEPGYEIVENLLKKAMNHQLTLRMNIINILEIYYGVYRDDGKQMAERIFQKIQSLPIYINRMISTDIFKNAAKLKAKFNISVSDSIAIAEANVLESEIVTSDHQKFDILEQENIVRIHWIR